MLSKRILFTFAGVLGLGTLLTLTGPVRPQDPGGQAAQGNATQEGVEPLTRGPIHEAFATPVNTMPTAGPVIPRQPPEPLEEVPPDQKPEGDNVTWTPGYWSWDDERSDFIWVSGFWRAPPPGRVWVPGRWQAAGGGSQWVPGFWADAQQSTVQYLPPPPEPVDVGPSVPAPDDTGVYVPGCWVYRETRYAWRPGYWADCRPGWVWTPAHYCWSPCGFVFVEGFWDLEPARRGLLFAPVYVAPGFVGRPSWHYRPSFVVASDFLVTALFVRPRWHHYYFGDYFTPAYRNSGYVAVVDYRVGRSAYDPLYGYYRGRHRDNPGWSRNLQELYAARYRGEAPRPPRTFVQQNNVVQNVTNTNINNINVTNVQNVALVQSLAQVNKSAVNLQPVSRERRAQAQRAAAEVRTLGQQRAQAETRLVSAGQATLRPKAAVQTVKLNLPASLVAAAIKSAQPPPPPGAGSRTGAETSKPAPKGQVTPGPLKAGTDPRLPPRAETKPPPRPEGKPEPKPGPRPETKPPVRPEVKPAPRPEAKPEPKPAPRPEVKPPPRPEGKLEPKPAPRPEVKPPARPETKPEGKPPARELPEARPLARPPEGKPATPEVRPGPRPEVKPDPRQVPRPEIKTAPTPPRPAEPERPKRELSAERPGVRLPTINGAERRQFARPEAQPAPRPQVPPPTIRTEPRPQPAPQHEILPHPERRPVTPPPAAQPARPRPAPPPPRVEPRPQPQARPAPPPPRVERPNPPPSAPRLEPRPAPPPPPPRGKDK
jgi:WXXGXW repeat (2 copies)